MKSAAAGVCSQRGCVYITGVQRVLRRTGMFGWVMALLRVYYQ
jgi:hypothetical protein